MSEMFWRRTNQILDLLEDTYTPGGILTWLTAKNANLDDQRPVDLIDAGKVDEVIAEARRVAGS